MARDTFEVYYNQNGRWQLHASYEASQRDLAIEEARTVEQKEGYPTRVIRESFLPESNTTEEVITWQSLKAKAINDADNMFGVGAPAKAAPKSPQRKQQAASAPRAAPQPEKKPASAKAAAPRPAAPRRPKAAKKKPGVVMRLLIVLMSSAAMALFAGVALIFIIYGLAQMGVIGQANRFPLVFGAVVSVFFLAAFVNLQKQFGILSMLKSQAAPQRRAPGGPEAMMAAARKRKPAQDVEFDQVDIQDLREKVIAEDLAEASTAEDAARDADDAPAELDADMDTERSPRPQAAPEPPAPAAPPQADARKDAPRPEERKTSPAPAPPAPPAVSAEAETRTAFQRFVTDAARFVTGEMNAFSRFGLNLYIAGAASVIGQAKRLSRDAQLGVLKAGLQSAGTPADRAETFCVELPSYGKNPKYAGMVQAGVKAMQGYMNGNSAVTAQIAGLLQEWNLPEKRAAIPSIITFVFTDIVGSTAMTQRLGNAGAQRAVRAHNTAVRGAIQAYKGREVKHTGDGIMATFPDPPSAAAACIKMQREIAAHNMQNPSVEVQVRIGINAGEAVEEENDFFGAAVQMTARICDKATKANIWVSQAVVDACKGQRIGFIPRGGFEMKGIQGAKRLYEVGWNDTHKNELADL